MIVNFDDIVLWGTYFQIPELAFRPLVFSNQLQCLIFDMILAKIRAFSCDKLTKIALLQYLNASLNRRFSLLLYFLIFWNLYLKKNVFMMLKNFLCDLSMWLEISNYMIGCRYEVVHVDAHLTLAVCCIVFVHDEFRCERARHVW